MWFLDFLLTLLLSLIIFCVPVLIYRFGVRHGAPLESKWKATWEKALLSRVSGRPFPDPHIPFRNRNKVLCRSVLHQTVKHILFLQKVHVQHSAAHTIQ